MIEILGEYSLSAAILCAAGAVLAAVAGARLHDARFVLVGRLAITAIAILFTIASAALLMALMESSFRFEYVTKYTERALPGGYKFAAFWAGQSGSLLLWAWVLAVLSVVAVWSQRGRSTTAELVSNASMAVACGFFAVLMLFVPEANPFKLLEGPVPLDGRGLNPMLQDPGMIIHPPLLFIGYAGFTIPFAILIGVLVVGRKDNHWLASIRRWVLFSWIFLTAGIVLGAWWAYVELGWGGYWAWDPVENASLLPWFTATGLLHTIIVQQHRGMFKRWNASLIALSFILCIFGTYLTRSGVIASVHAFPESWVGRLFLFFIIFLVALTIALFIWRRNLLRPERELEGLVSREGAFLLANVLLIIMMLITLIGTIFPLLSEPFGKEITVKPEFYNTVVAPMGLLLAFVMAHGPVLAFGKSAAEKIVRDMTIPGFAAIAAVIFAAAFTWNAWALACTFIAALGTCTVIISFARVVTARHRSTGENWLLAAVRLIDADKRRYGAQVTHLGMMMIIMGVAGSSLFKIEETHELAQGQSVAVGTYTVMYESIQTLEEANYQAIEATVRVTDAGGESVLLRPQVRYFRGRDEPNTEVDIRSSLLDDVYIQLAGWEDGGKVIAIKAKVNPLVIWIWLGGIVMMVGGSFCMLPRFLPHTRRAAASNPIDEPTPEHAPDPASTVEAETPA